MVDTVCFGNFYSVIFAAVVDNQPFDGAKARYFPRKRRKGDRERLRFVKAWYLDD
jgi:hypothetical protein